MSVWQYAARPAGPFPSVCLDLRPLATNVMNHPGQVIAKSVAAHGSQDT